jgi:hypothetical protein
MSKKKQKKTKKTSKDEANPHMLEQGCLSDGQTAFGRGLTSSGISQTTQIRLTCIESIHNSQSVDHAFLVPHVSAPVAFHTIGMQRAEWTMCKPTPQSEDDNA